MAKGSLAASSRAGQAVERRWRQAANQQRLMSVSILTNPTSREEEGEGLCEQTEHVVTVCGCSDCGDGVDERMAGRQRC